MRDFGALGNGITDDHDAIMDAFDEGVATSLPVFFPMTVDGGRYLVATSLALTAAYSNLKLVGGGGAGIKVDSTARPAMTLEDGFHHLTIESMSFYGPNNDIKDENFYAAIEIHSGATDISIIRSLFDHVSVTQAYDSRTSGRFYMDGCYMRNCPIPVRPPNDTKINNCWFINDEYVATRAQAIYKYGSFENIQITGCTFYRITKQAIQIRGVEAAWNQMQNFRIEGNTFIECNAYSIFCGSDSYPNVTGATIIGNTFIDCASPVQLQGQGSAQVTGNVFHWTWRFPYGPQAFGAAISVSTGVGLPGHYAIARGINVSNNRFSHLNPFVGKVRFDSQPADGDTITVGAFTYTWRTTPALFNEIEIGANTRLTTDNLSSILRGFGNDLVTAPNNVIRSGLDATNDFYGTDNTLAVIISYDDFEISASGSYCTITDTQDCRTFCPFGIQCNYLIAPQVSNNTFDDFAVDVVISSCRGGEVYDNHGTSQTLHATHILALYNVDVRYRANRSNILNFLRQGAPSYNQYFDGFSIIDDEFVQLQEGNNGALMGRSGSVTVGDGKAFTWLWYGRGVAADDDPSTRMFRWDDGDQVNLHDGFSSHIFTYKTTSPGVGEFNSPDTLLALLNGVLGVTATFQTFTNRLGTVDPKVMIRVGATDAGTAGNNMRLYVTRFKWPGDTTTYLTVQQPLINGIILRNFENGEEYAQLRGGAATPVSTFVYSPIANPDRGVEVWGADAASVALSPRVYRADIVPGVGFKITHGAGSGTEQFYYRINS